jgi:hypothetical protein
LSGDNDVGIKHYAWRSHTDIIYDIVYNIKPCARCLWWTVPAEWGTLLQHLLMDLPQVVLACAGQKPLYDKQVCDRLGCHREIISGQRSGEALKTLIHRNSG